MCEQKGRPNTEERGLRCGETQDVTEVSTSQICHCNKPSAILLSSPWERVREWHWITLSAAQRCARPAVTVVEQSKLHLFPLFCLFLCPCHSFTSLLREHRGPGAMPCSPSNHGGMQMVGQRNPGLTLKLSTQEGREMEKKKNSTRVGGVWALMRTHVMFHPVENCRG